MNDRSARTRAAAAEQRIAESIAAKVIEIVRAELADSADQRVVDQEWIDSAEVARRSGFSRAWVYENAGSARRGAGRRRQAPAPAL
jgi:hypothetical protein